MIGPEIDLVMTNYQSHLSLSIRELLRETTFSDVTLVSDDQVQIPGHKIILGAASPVLNNFFLNNSNPKPLIYLRGIDDSILESLLQYIYLGEVQIKYDSLKHFLEAAKDLKIKDLCDENIELFDYECKKDKEEGETHRVREDDPSMNTKADDRKSPFTPDDKENDKTSSDLGAKKEVLNKRKQKALHDQSKKCYRCDLCNKELPDRTTLTNHRIIRHHI